MATPASSTSTARVPPLPQDVLANAFSFLTPRKAAVCSTVSREWYLAGANRHVVDNTIRKIVTELRTLSDWDLSSDGSAKKNIGLTFAGDQSQVTRNLTIRYVIHTFNERTGGRVDVLRKHNNSIDIIIPDFKDSSLIAARAARYLGIPLV